jgi:two-component system cell cycle response regulator DivK
MMDRTVLIIEDNEQNLYLMRFLLENHGFTVSEARNGPEGIQSAFRLLPDLILIDIQLPLMDGYSVTKELRKNKVIEKIPIIAVTSYAMAGDREHALDAGATDYIEKPINPETFVTQISTHLASRRDV